MGPGAYHRVERVELALPFWRYFELFRQEPHAFLLDSASSPGDARARFSFLGGRPSLVLRAWREPREGSPRGARVELQDREGSPRVSHHPHGPFDVIRELLATHAPREASMAGHPLPFLRGAVGYFGYDAGAFIEDLPRSSQDDQGLPDICLMFSDVVLGHCHRTGRSYLSIVERGGSSVRDELLQQMQAFERHPPTAWTGPAPRTSSPPRVESSCDEATYRHLVDRAKTHIEAGDAFEICLTHRMEAPLRADPWTLYSELRRINPAPFAAYLQLDDFQVVSSSPERFLRLDPDGTVESRPIKGTRPRGATPEDDERQRSELASSIKEQAENTMIVDLVRNDLGRVCRFGSIHVPELRVLEPYATVWQMVSTVRGQLDHGRDALDVIVASFPGGSMTGAPKIEAMKIIDRLEPVQRGVYAGSIGYLDASGAMDLNIVIRSFVVKDGVARFGVGGAIVADSSPREEYEETQHKARALITALGNVT